MCIQTVPVARGSQSLLAVIVAAILLASCATAGSDSNLGPPAAVPTFRVGDRWVYHAVEGYRQKIVWDETHEVTAVGADGITVRVTLKGPTVDIQRTEVWAAPGVIRSGAVYEAETDRFDPNLIRYKYPLVPGTSWAQDIRDLNKADGPYGPIRWHVTAGGYESISTAVGTVNALKLRILIQLDDETFYRYPTQCEYIVWYAPDLGVMVREQKRSYSMDKGFDSAGRNPGQNGDYELVSFMRGR